MLAKPFLFEEAFDQDDDDGARDAGGKAAPVYDEATLLQEREAAFAEGVAHGRQEAEAEMAQAASRQAADAMGAIAAHLEMLLHAADRAEDAAIEAAPLAAANAVRAAFGALARQLGPQEIEAVIREAVRRAGDEPRIVARLAEADYEGLAPDIAGVAEKIGYPGRIVVLEDADIAPGDVKVEWADGGIARDLGRMTAAIESALVKLAEPTASPEEAETPPDGGPEAGATTDG